MSTGTKRVYPQRLSRQLRSALYSQDADQVIAAALTILERRARTNQAALTSPDAVRDYLRLSLGARQYEVFVVIHLDAQHRVISIEEMFRGTLTHTAVHPREIVKAALAANAAAVIFAHNHPSGTAQPSQADKMLTRTLKAALELVDVRVLDHFVIAGPNAVSFAERGLI